MNPEDNSVVFSFQKGQNIVKYIIRRKARNCSETNTKIKLRMEKKAKILKTALFLSIVIMAISFLLPHFCFAQEAVEDLERVGEAAGMQTETPLAEIIGSIIRIFLGLLGIVLLIIIIYAGWLWMTAGGDAEQIEKAKKWITNGVIGLIICLFAYSIVTFIINKLAEEGIISSQEFTSSYGSGGSGYGGGALGNGVIEDHYPPRNATNIARNTFIMVKFYEPLNSKSVMIDGALCEEGSEQLCGDINWTNIQIFESANAGENGEPPTDQADLVTAGTMALTADKKIFFFKPAQPLGNAVEDVSYTVYLNSGLQNEDGGNMFGEFGDYAWLFEVGTYIDLTPPRVSSVYPLNFENPLFKYFANSIIQINFNEPVLPPPQSFTEGIEDDKLPPNSIYIEYEKDGAVGYVAGTFNVGLNQFRTIEFLPAEDCGQGIINSCGETPKCLPRDATIRPYIKSASVLEGVAAFPFDGIVDTAGNSLDGNSSGTQDGPIEDDYPWEFLTSGNLDLEPPRIEGIQPTNAQGEVSIDVPVKADYNEGLSANTANSKNAFITGDDWAKWFTVHLENVEGEPDANGQTTTTTNNDVLEISHADFDKLPEEEEDSNPLKYYPIITNRLKDLQQNCFYPCVGPGCSAPEPTCCEGQSQPGAGCGY